VCSGIHVGRQGQRLDLLHALQCGLIELVDSASGDALTFPPPSAQSPGYIEISPYRPAHILPPGRPQPPPQVRVGFVKDWTNAIWKTLLQPGKSYAFRLSRRKGETWAYDGVATSDAIIPPSRKLSVARDEETSIPLAVYADPPPPRLFAKLSMPEICHLSGTPPFTVFIEISTDSKCPLTLNKSRTALSSFGIDFNTLDDLFSCRNRDTNEPVDWPVRFGCWEADIHPDFPDDDDFVQISDSEPWRFEYVLKEDEAPGGPGGLEMLEVGQTYEAWISEDFYPNTGWRFGTREEILAGSKEEKKKRWNGFDSWRQGHMGVEVLGEAVVFQAVA
jgi:hypothetical protein